MEHLRHITTEGERWDNLAYIYYGNATAYEQIILANPQVPYMLELPSGLEILIPVIELDNIETNALPLAPWEVE